ncbi:MAG TPA: methyltransferase domain-containing protein [Polyangiaceae bacterium]
MNRIYRYQRHFYDLTRKSFLFGRDELLRRMHIRRGDRVLEVGCGTARNLLKLHARHGHAQLYGLDASTEMLATAQGKLRRRRLQDQVRLEHGLAEELADGRIFGAAKFDVIFFSYSLSMIPACTASIEAALASLNPGGRIYIVDFGDQGGLPRFLRHALERWLGLFGVKYRHELYEHLRASEARGRGQLVTEGFALRYGIFAEFSTQPRESSAPLAASA